MIYIDDCRGFESSVWDLICTAYNPIFLDIDEYELHMKFEQEKRNALYEKWNTNIKITNNKWTGLHMEHQCNKHNMDNIVKKIKMEHINEISLYKNNIDNNGIKILSSFLKNNNESLTMLWIHGNNINDLGIDYLINAINHINNKLTHIWIYDNPVNDFYNLDNMCKVKNIFVKYK